MAKVYVSSTLADLKTEREDVMNWLVARGHQPIHSYHPDSETVRDSCLEDVDGCDLYVLMLGHRYGFQPDNENPDRLSITQLEYRRAARKPRIALLRTSIPTVDLSDIHDPERLKRVEDFRKEVQREVRAAEFGDSKSLIQALSTGVERALEKYFGTLSSEFFRERLLQSDIGVMLTKTVADQAQAISRLSMQLETKSIENEALRQRLTELENRSMASSGPTSTRPK